MIQDMLTVSWGWSGGCFFGKLKALTFQCQVSFEGCTNIQHSCASSSQVIDDLVSPTHLCTGSPPHSSAAGIHCLLDHCFSFCRPLTPSSMLQWAVYSFLITSVSSWMKTHTFLLRQGLQDFYLLRIPSKICFSLWPLSSSVIWRPKELKYLFA